MIKYALHPFHRFGSRQPISFLKTMIESKGYYDMDKHFKWKHLEDLNVIATMGMAAGVRYDIDERFLARFFMFHVPLPEESSLRDIYTTLLTGHLSSFADKVRICAGPLVEIMLNVFRVTYPTRPEGDKLILSYSQLVLIIIRNPWFLSLYD